MAGAFAWIGPPPPARVVVVDDVVTTGATLVAAAQALHAAGAEEVDCLALAQG
ncbi:MAG TPA: phosphoribosyltransferase family protein [Candidatus Dormibacteraeota bacterium]|nr:phosphoribosyltransferase family protein [Candidatus Dormibacteraeota bacterium]